MHVETEVQQFFEWLANLGDKKPVVKEPAYGKVFECHEKPPKVGGKIYRIYGKGSLTVWEDALVFIANPPKGATATLASAMVSGIIDKATHGVAGIASSVGSALVGGTSVEAFVEQLVNPWSMFIPLTRISHIKGGEGLLAMFFGQSLDIFFEDHSGKAVHAYFWSPDSSFSSRALRKALARSSTD